MVKCTEAFRMIILRLSETNCTECQATSLPSMVLKMWILLLLIQFGEIKMLKKKIQRKHIVETQERYKRQMSNRSNFVTYFYFVVLSYTTWLPEKHKEPKCTRSIYDKHTDTDMVQVTHQLYLILPLYFFSSSEIEPPKFRIKRRDPKNV